jgi:hypothetical protein
MTVPPHASSEAPRGASEPRYRVRLDDPRGGFVGEVSLAVWDAIAFRILSPKPFPPGARVSLALVTDLDGPADPLLSFRLKVHRCRRDERGLFEISGGLMDIRREATAALSAMTGRSA